MEEIQRKQYSAGVAKNKENGLCREKMVSTPETNTNQFVSIDKRIKMKKN